MLMCQHRSIFLMYSFFLDEGRLSCLNTITLPKASYTLMYVNALKDCWISESTFPKPEVTA